MKIKTFILSLALATFLFSQGRSQIPPPGKDFNLLYSELNIFPSAGNNVTCFYSFRIPYNRFVFVKNDTGYIAKFRLGVEVYDSLGNFADRQIAQDDIFVKSYEETDSDNEYYQGVLTFKLHPDNYKFLPVFTDINSREERKLTKIDVLLKSEIYKSILPPVFINSQKEKCGDKEITVLTNFNGSIPFDNNNYDIIIPSIDTTLNNLRVVIEADGDTVFNNNVKESSVAGINFQSCNNFISLTSNNNITLPTRNFIIKGISPLLPEGNLSFYYYRNNDKKPIIVQKKQCVWFDKPRSLQNPEFAIKILKYFAGQDKVDSLLESDEKDYPKVLYEFWKKYDPTPSTRYNELMREYYLRVDYTAMHFTSLSGKKGYDTDRGKVYIQFGKPKKIERYSNDEGKVMETWYYDDEKKFSFVDNLGTGDFSMQN